MRASFVLLPSLFAVLLTSCGSAGEPREPSRASFPLDETRGVFRGIALRDPESRVVERFGPDEGKLAGPVTPLGAEAAPATFASTPGTPSPDDRTAAVRYRGMSFVTNNRRVYVIMSSLAGTRTLRGVSVGGALEEAQKAYRGLACDTATDAHGDGTFPYCGGRLAPGRFVYFGGDPIDTIAVARVPLYGG